MFFKKLGLILVTITLSSSFTFAAQTAPNDDGKGNVLYLDRHYVDCNGRGIKSFRLFRPTTRTIAYDYQCQPTEVGAGVQRFTLPNDDGRGNMLYLDRHNVNCDGKALVSFGLYRPNRSTLGYQYWCGSIPLKNVSTFETRATVDGKGNALYLDRQHIQCRAGVLTGFQLFRPTDNTIAYTYTCGE